MDTDEYKALDNTAKMMNVLIEVAPALPVAAVQILVKAREDLFLMQAAMIADRRRVESR